MNLRYPLEVDETEVVLTRLESGHILAAPISESGDFSPNSNSGFSSLIGSAGPLITAVLEGLGCVDSKNTMLFEMSPESLQQFREARLDEVGPYFRGVLRNIKGQASHQVQLREVRRMQVPSGFSILLAAQMAAIQVRLDQIERNLDDLAEDVTEIKNFLERQQSSEISAAFQTVAEIYQGAQQNGEISGANWLRTVECEQPLRAQRDAVWSELENRLTLRDLSGPPKEVQRKMEKLDPERVTELIDEHRLLSVGLSRWTELWLLRLYKTNELSVHDLKIAEERLEILETQQLSIPVLLNALISQLKEIGPRKWSQKLVTDGLFLGEKRDSKALQEIETGRLVLEEMVYVSQPDLPDKDSLQFLYLSPEDEIFIED